jgi:drug/metabolite transporter (DMT)-like permease
MSNAAATSLPTPILSKQRLAIAALVLAACAIGFSPIFVRLSETGPVATGFYRTALALPILIVWSIGERRLHKPSAAAGSWRNRLLIGFAGFCFAGDLATWHWAIKLTPVANATLLANLAPIFVTLGAAIFFRERVTRGFAVALACSLVGSIVLASSHLALDANLAGDGWAVITALFYAGYFLALSRVRIQVSAATAMMWSTGLSALWLLPLALWDGETMLPATSHGWALLVGLALVAQVAGQSLVGWALAHLPASYSAISLLLQPVVAASLAWALLDEPLGWQQGIGGMIILISIVAARRASR